MTKEDKSADIKARAAKLKEDAERTAASIRAARGRKGTVIAPVAPPPPATDAADEPGGAPCTVARMRRMSARARFASLQSARKSESARSKSASGVSNSATRPASMTSTRS